MNRNLLLLSVVIVILGCSKPAEQTTTITAASTTTQATSATSAPVSVPSSTQAPAPVSTAPGAGALATQETNWKGVVAEVTEFRRKGNTLTAKVRFTNRGSEEPQPEIKYDEVYLIDTGAGKKYNVLKDEKNDYIALLASNWHERWYHQIKPGESYLIWMKFPAPPADVKAITLQIPNTPPFEDIAIQE
jgi:hypothetical protein